MTTLENILNPADTAKKIDSIKGRARTLHADVDLCCKSALIHAAEHGDLTLASRLYAAVPSQFRADVKRYFIACAPVHYDNKGKQFKRSGKGGEFIIDLDTPFDAIARDEKEPAEYNRQKTLSAIVAFMDKHADRAIKAGDVELCTAVVDIAGVLAGLINAK